jgi:carbamoyl-phosphate synthase large subunit
MYEGVELPKVLVTGVGGGAGQSILKALRGANYLDVLAVDSSPLAAGLYFGYKGLVGLEALHPDYVSNLLKISMQNEVQYIFPGHDVELKVLANSKQMFLMNGIKVIISSPKVIEICDDKLQTANFLAVAGFNFPKTQSFKEYEWDGNSVILKPQKGGARSKNTFLARSEDEYNKFSVSVDPENCVVQEFIDGDEYTCGSVFFEDNLTCVISMKRELRNGDTYKAFSLKSDSINNYVSAVVQELKPFGACNVQLKLRDGEPYIFEINARCSGTTAARALVGLNEPDIILKFLESGEVPIIDYEEKTILRYWNEIVIDNDEIFRMPKVESK